MKKLPVLIVFVICFVAVQIRAAFPLYEPFADATAFGGSAYTIDTKLAGNTNANGPVVVWHEVANTVGTGIGPTNVAGNLSYPGLPNSTGNMAYFTNATARSARMTLPSSVTSGTVYYSYKIKITDISNLSTAGAYFNGFSSGTGPTTGALTALNARLWVKKLTSTYVFGISKSQASFSAANVTLDTTEFSPGDTVFIVASYTYVGGANDDVVKLWVNPGNLGLNTEPTATVSQVAGEGSANGLTSCQSFVFGSRATTIAQANMDDIRVGLTWKNVTAGVTITGQPSNVAANAGGNAVFTVTATETGATYQWKKNGVNLTNGNPANVSGATSASLTLTGVYTTDADTYTVDVIGSNTETSSGAVLTVIDPGITTQPTASQTLPAGVTTSLTIVAEGTPTVTYQWKKDGSNLSDGGSISGAATASLTLASIAPGNAGTYACAVTNGLGAGTISSNSILIVANDPDILAQPTSLTNNYGTEAVFTVVASGTPTLVYQWKKNGSNLTDGGNIAGATTASLTIISAGDPDEGNYSVIVTNGNNQTVTSSAVSLTVIDPIINTQPASITNAAGTVATFTVAAVGTPPLTYQWKKNGVDLTDGGNISGATAGILTINSVGAIDATNYSVIVSNSAGSSVASSSANLTVLFPPTITSTPADRSVSVGANVVFAVTATTQLGTGALSYQWQSNSVDIAGANTNALALLNVQLTHAAIYSVIVSNDVGGTTASATLSVTPGNIRLYNTNLVVLRQGEGNQPVATNGNSISLDQYTTAGAYVSTTVIPDQGADALIQDPALSVFSGGLSRSADGKELSFSGYNTNRPSYTNLSLSSTAGALSIRRAVAKVNGLSLYGIGATTTAFSANAIRAGVTDGTNNYWMGSATLGVRYFSPSPTATGQAVGSATALGSWGIRKVRIINGVLYFATTSTGTLGAGSLLGIWKWSALPTANESPVNVINTGAGSSPAEFALSPNDNIMYVADERTSALGGGIQRWTNNTGTWTLEYTLTNGLAGFGAMGLTVDFSGPDAVIYGTTLETAPNYNNRLFAITDSGAASMATVLAHSGPNQAFKGVEFGPVSDAPGITSQPVSSTNFSGTTATFSVTASGTGPFAYQWQKDGIDLINGGNISGATSATLTLSSITEADGAIALGYTVVVTNELGTVVSDPAALTIAGPPTVNVTPLTIIGHPQGANAQFTANATGDLLSYQWYHGAVLLGGATDSGLTVSNVQSADIVGWTVVVSNLAGVVTSTPPAVIASLDADTTAPKLAVLTPGKNKGTNQISINVTGTVKETGGDNNGIVSSVTYSLNLGATNSAILTPTTPGSYNWTSSSPIILTPGLNTLNVWAKDQADNGSFVSVPFYYDTTNDLVLHIEGQGNVKMGTSVYSGATTLLTNTFKVGRSYKLDAFVGKGTNYIFTNWVTEPNDLGSSTNKWVQKSSLTFIMQSNMVITAKFNANPFTPVAGTYNGLFSETGGITHETAGFIQVKAKDKATYSGFLLFGGVKRPFSGKFLTDGTATGLVIRTKTTNQPPVNLAFALDLTPGETISGTVSATNGAWSSTITADKAVFSLSNPETNNLGSYTLQIPTSPGAPTSSPGGVGYSTVTNNPLGVAKFGGYLSDNQKITLSMNLTRDGHVPFYVGLYKTAAPKDFRGSLMGWLTFTNGEFGLGSDNVLTWIKQGNSEATAQYAAGFSNSVEVAGSKYVAPAPGIVPVKTGDYVIVSEGNLTDPVTNVVTAVAPTATGTKVTLSKTNTLGVENKATITFKAKDGTVTGGFNNPADKTKTQGIWLQNTTNVSGYFLKTGHTESGTFRVEQIIP